MANTDTIQLDFPPEENTSLQLDFPEEGGHTIYDPITGDQPVEGFTMFDPAVPAAKVIAALQFLDRPRAANVGFFSTLMQGGSVDDAATEYSKGLKGEAHPLMGDLFFEMARENSEAQKKGQILGPNTLTGIVQKLIALIPAIQNDFPTPEEDTDPDGNPIPYNWTDAPDSPELQQAQGELQAKLTSLFSPEEADALYAAIGGTIMDVIVDPVTYTGVGLTKSGKLAKIKEAVDAGELTIKSTSNLSRDLAEYEARGKLKPYEEAFPERLKAGQERVWIGGIPIPAKIAGPIAKGIFTSHEIMAGSTIGQGIKKLFSTEYGLIGENKKFRDLEETFSDILVMRREAALKDNADLMRKINTLAEDLSRVTRERVTPDALNKFITSQVELFGRALAKKDTILGTVDVAKTNSLLAKLPERMRPHVRPEYLTKEAQEVIQKNPQILKTIEDLRIKNDTQLRLEQSNSILGASLVDSPTVHKNYINNLLTKAKPTDKVIYDPVKKRYIKREMLEKDLKKAQEAEIDADRVAYFTHSATPEFKDAIKKQREGKKGKRTGEPFVYSKNHASKIQRNYRNMTINEINQLGAAGLLPGYEGIKITKAFNDNPAVVQILRDMRHDRSMETLKFMEEAKDKFGKTVTKAEAADLPPGWAAPRNPMLGGYAFPEEIAKRLDAHYDVLLNKSNTNPLLSKVYDPVQNWYKAWTLGVFPEYHARNALGNVWNNYITGTKNPIVYKIAMNIQHGEAGFISVPGGGKVSYDEIREQVGKLGIRNKGQMSADIEQSLINEMGQGKWATLSTNNKAIHYGQKVGEATDNNARIAKFVDELQKGSTFDRAEVAVRHALFDYTDLTMFEKNTAKRLFPFYTWSRKNIPLQLEMMVRSPGKFKAVDTARQEIERSTSDVGEQGLANWLLENYAVRTKIDKEDGLPRYFLLGAWLPAGDIWKLAATPDRLFTDLTSPLIKTPLELYFNYNSFKKKAINREDEEGNLIPEKVDFMGARVSPRMAHAFKTLRLLKAMDDAVPKDKKMSDIRRERDRTPEEIIIDLVTGFKLYAQDLEMNKVYQSDKKVKTFTQAGRAMGEAATPFITKEGKIIEPNPKELKEIEDFLNKGIGNYERLWKEDIKKMQDFKLDFPNESEQ